MLNRHIDSVLERHYAQTDKAILLTGARQTGKTFAIRRYAEQFGLHLVEMNFLLQPETRDILSGAANVQDLLLRLSAYANQPLTPGKTLVFFDEVQECPVLISRTRPTTTAAAKNARYASSFSSVSPISI